MDDFQPQPAKQTARYSNLAFMTCGAFLSVVTFATSFDTATRPWNGVSSVMSVDTAEKMQALAAAQPGPNEWQLAVARTRPSDGDTTSNRYTVEITPVRGTALLRIDVIGRSPDRTAAFSHWLTGYFARDLAGSFASHGIAQLYHSDLKSLVSQAPGPSVPLRMHLGTLVLSLFTPILLLLSGITLYQATKANHPKT